MTLKFDDFCEEYGIGKILKSYDSEYVTTEGGITKWSETIYLDDEGHVFSEVSHCGVGKGCFWTEPECYMCDGSYNEEVKKLKRLERESKKVKFNESCSSRFKQSKLLEGEKNRDRFFDMYNIGRIIKSYDFDYVDPYGIPTRHLVTIYQDDQGHVFTEERKKGFGKGNIWTEQEYELCKGSFFEEVNDYKKLVKELDQALKDFEFNESCSSRFKRSKWLNESSEIQDDLEQLIKSAFIDKDLKQLIKNAFITKELDYANLTDEEKSLVQFIDGIRNGSRFLLNGHYENTENYEELVRGTFNKCAIVSNKYSNEFDYVSITKEDVVGASVPYTYLEIYNDGDLKITFDH